MPTKYRLKSAQISYCNLQQENLANAKVSARQQCVYEGPQRRKSTANQRKEHYVDEYIQWVTTLSLTTWI